MRYGQVSALEGACTGGEQPYACFLLGTGGMLSNGVAVPKGPSSDAYLNRACAVDQMGVVCVEIALHLLKGEDTPRTRRTIADFAARGCAQADNTFREEACESKNRLSKLVVGGNIRGMFPPSLAGVAFGASPQQVAALCQRAEMVDERRMLCFPAPKNPFLVDGGLVATFCEGRACELSLLFQNLDDVQADAIMRRVIERYGEAGGLEVRLPCASPALRQREWRVGWQDPDSGGIVALRTCSTTQPGAMDLLIVYSTEEGRIASNQEIDDF